MVHVHRQHKGFGLIEIVIASSIISVAMISLAFTLVMASRLSARSTDLVRANFVAEEGLEAMRFLRDKSWSSVFASLTPGTNYYLSFNASTATWSVGTTDPGLLGGTFRRRITVASVQRNASDDIVSSGGTVDSNTLKVISTVTASTTSTTTVETYLTNIFNN